MVGQKSVEAEKKQEGLSRFEGCYVVWASREEFQEVGMELVTAQHVRAAPAAQMEWRAGE